MCFPSIAGIRHGESLPKNSKQAMLFLSPKVLSINTEPPQTVGLYISPGLFPTKGVSTEWQDPGHDEEYNELQDPAAGLMLHLPMVKALRTTRGTWEIFFPCFMRFVASGPKKRRGSFKKYRFVRYSQNTPQQSSSRSDTSLVSRNDKMKNYIKPFRTKKSRKQLIFLAIKYIFKHTDIHVNFYEWSLICKNGKIKKD